MRLPQPFEPHRQYCEAMDPTKQNPADLFCRKFATRALEHQSGTLSYWCEEHLPVRDHFHYQYTLEEALILK